MADKNSLRRKEQEFLIHLKQKCDIFRLKVERGLGINYHRSLWETDNQKHDSRYNKIARKLRERGYITQRNGSRDKVKYVALTKKGLEHIS